MCLQAQRGVFISCAGVLIFRQMWPILSHKNGGWALLHLWALPFLFIFKSCQLSLYGVEEARGSWRGYAHVFVSYFSFLIIFTRSGSAQVFMWLICFFFCMYIDCILFIPFPPFFWFSGAKLFCPHALLFTVELTWLLSRGKIMKWMCAACQWACCCEIYDK